MGTRSRFTRLRSGTPSSGARSFDEIVLWFEHDLYDQLQILQILAVLQGQGLGAGILLLVQSEQYLGMLTLTN